MYFNLLAEMARRGISGKRVAEAIGCGRSAIYAKLHGRIQRGFTTAEKLAICNLLELEPTEETYDYLFARAA